jgi:hypothetical protein
MAGLWRRLLVVALISLGLVAVAPSAQAHDDDETQEGYVLIQQALAHLVHDSGPDGVDLAMEKVDDALATEDQEGVDVAGVRAGMAALEASQVEEALGLLQDSIAEAIADRPLATGYDTGTSLVSRQLAGRGPLSGGDWAVLLVAAAVGGLGVWLSVRFRPHDSVGALRLLLGPKSVTSGEPARTTRVRTWRHPR